jgi:hypothetical protein
MRRIMKRVFGEWINDGLTTPAVMAANTTPVGHVLSGRDVPQDMTDILLVQFYLHRLSMMAISRPNQNGLYTAYAQMKFSPSELNDTSNSPILQKRIKIFQSSLRNSLAVDGRVSVMPGNQVEGTYKDRSGVVGFRRYTIGWLILEWQFLTEVTKSPKRLSQQNECPPKLQSALAAIL